MCVTIMCECMNVHRRTMLKEMQYEHLLLSTNVISKNTQKTQNAYEIWLISKLLANG